jgi:hypothetical protein
MKADQLERAAYMAAHRILTTNTGAPELACPGARRSHAVDVIANVIKDVFELHCADPEEIKECLRVLDGRAAPERTFPSATRWASCSNFRRGPFRDRVPGGSSLAQILRTSAEFLCL